MIKKETKTQFPITTEENGVLIFRNRISIIEDGKEISHYFEHRQVSPGDDYSGENEHVKKLGKALHTKAAVDEFKKAKPKKEK